MSVPGKVVNVQVNPLYDGSHLLVSWSPLTSVPAVLGYNVYVGLKNSFTGATKLNSTLIPLSQYNADVPQLMRQNGWYFVTAVNADGEGPASDSSESSAYSPYAVSTYANMKYIVAEMIRRRNKILELDGENAQILVRKVAGTRCSCFEPTRGHGVDRCNLCYGTNFTGGYVAIPAKVRLTNINELKTRGETGLEINNKPRVRMGIYPLVTSMDLLVRRNNVRYRITDINPGIVQGALTRQTFTIHEIEPTQVEYDVPITW